MRHARPRDVGLDVHKASIAVAYARAERDAAVICLGPIGPRQGDIATRVRPLTAKAKHWVVVSEAGPCGSWLDR
jgi:hypothetical protein